MKQFKKIVISLPDSAAKELDRLAQLCNQDISSLIAGLVRREYAGKIPNNDLADGYRQMGRINLEWAENCLLAERETLNWYEENLSECEQD